MSIPKSDIYGSFDEQIGTSMLSDIENLYKKIIDGSEFEFMFFKQESQFWAKKILIAEFQSTWVVFFNQERMNFVLMARTLTTMNFQMRTNQRCYKKQTTKVTILVLSRF